MFCSFEVTQSQCIFAHSRDALGVCWCVYLMQVVAMHLLESKESINISIVHAPTLQVQNQLRDIGSYRWKWNCELYHKSKLFSKVWLRRSASIGFLTPPLGIGQTHPPSLLQRAIHCIACELAAQRMARGTLLKMKRSRGKQTCTSTFPNITAQINLSSSHGEELERGLGTRIIVPSSGN